MVIPRPYPFSLEADGSRAIASVPGARWHPGMESVVAGYLDLRAPWAADPGVAPVAVLACPSVVKAAAQVGAPVAVTTRSIPGLRTRLRGSVARTVGL